MSLVELMGQWSFGALDWLVIGLGIALAYIVFGIAGFGTALVAGPILIMFMPLSKIIPLLVLLDFVAAFGNLLQSRRDVVKPELLRLLPCMAIGCTLGVIFLLNLHSDLLLLLMGLFISTYAIYSLAVRAKPTALAAGWSVPMGVVGGLFGALFGSPSHQAIDCDASAIMLKNGKFTDKTDLVYFGNLKHKSGTVNHMGDNLTGAGEGDDEQIVIDLSRVPAEYDKIVIVVNIYQAVKRKQHFGMIQNAFIRLVDARNNKEMCKYNLTENYSGMTAMIFGEIYRYNGEWKFNAVGNGTTDPGLGELCQRFV